MVFADADFDTILYRIKNAVAIMSNSKTMLIYDSTTLKCGQPIRNGMQIMMLHQK